MNYADESLERMVSGALRSCIDAHGPITRHRIGSAAKRIAHQIAADLAGRREFYDVPEDTRIVRIYRNGSWLEDRRGSRQHVSLEWELTKDLIKEDTCEST